MKKFFVLLFIFVGSQSVFADSSADSSADLSADEGKCIVRVSGLRFYKKWNPARVRKVLDRNRIDVDGVVFRLKKDLIVVEVYDDSDQYCADVAKVIQKKMSRTARVRRNPLGTPIEKVLRVK